MHSLPQGYRALVIGASGAIGAGFVAALQADPRCGLVIGLHRRSEPALDLDDEASVAQAAQQLHAQGPFHLIVHAAGVLHTAAGMPEKRLAQLNTTQMSEVFRVNTFGPALVLAHFVPQLCRERGLMAFLSATVCSAVGPPFAGHPTPGCWIPAPPP